MAKLKNNKELFIGILFLVIGAVYLVSAFFIPSYEGYGGQNISSSFMPKVLGIMLVVLSIMQIYGARKAAAVHAAAPEKATDAAQGEAGGVTQDNVAEFDDDAAMRGASTKSMLIIFAILVAYIALMPIAGFILSTAFFLLASMLVLTPANKRNIVLIIVLTLVVSVGVYFLFVDGLSLVLPAGLLGIG